MYIKAHYFTLLKEIHVEKYLLFYLVTLHFQKS